MIILGTNSIKDTGYDVANSCRFNRADSPNLTKTPSSSGNLRKWTWSCWVKRSSISNGSQTMFNAGSSANNQIRFDSDDTINFYQYNSGYTARLATNQKFRDVSAWYHIVAHWDTDNSTAGDRMKLFVNGTEVTSFATDTNPSQNLDSYFGASGTALYVGDKGDGAEEMDGYLAEVVFIDGQNLAPTSFGEFDEDSPRIWKPKDVSELSSSKGTNGFYLDFEDSSNLGNDAFGGTDLTETNLAATDQSLDTCTNNFATWNPLAYTGKTAMAEGNLQGYGDNNDSHNDGGIATIGVSTGKWYWENKITAVGGSVAVGIFPNTVTVRDGVDMFAATNSIYYKSNGKKQVSDSASNYGDSYTTNDIIGVALNLDDNEIKFYKNGTVQNSGTAISVTSISDFYFPVQAGYTNSHVTANFGNPPYANSSDAADENGYGAFEYAPPSGYLALCTKNLGSDGG